MVFDVYVCMFCFMFGQGLVLWTELRKGIYIYEEEVFEAYVCL